LSAGPRKFAAMMLTAILKGLATTFVAKMPSELNAVAPPVGFLAGAGVPESGSFDSIEMTLLERLYSFACGEQQT